MSKPPVIPAWFHAGEQRVAEVYRVDYQKVAELAAAAAREQQVPPAAADRRRLCLLLVDVQNTFCIPGFELYVQGAEHDNLRLRNFILANLSHITQIACTLDSHLAIMIFHPKLWVRGEGKATGPAGDVPPGAHPQPYTLISHADVAGDVWRVNAAAASFLGFDPAFLQRHALHYTAQLEQDGKFALMVWPYHAMLGGIGHALVSAIEEVVFYHAIARSAQTEFQVKGLNPLTENYSVLRPEVLTGPGGAAIGAAKNERFIEQLLGFDAVVVAGQAKSHCVAWTVDDLLAEIRSRDPQLAGRVYLLEDCSSPVIVPGADFTEAADAAYRRFAAAGMHVVRSTQPLHTWPGLGPA